MASKTSTLLATTLFCYFAMICESRPAQERHNNSIKEIKLQSEETKMSLDEQESGTCGCSTCCHHNNSSSEAKCNDCTCCQHQSSSNGTKCNDFCKCCHDIHKEEANLDTESRRRRCVGAVGHARAKLQSILGKSNGEAAILGNPNVGKPTPNESIAEFKKAVDALRTFTFLGRKNTNLEAKEGTTPTGATATTLGSTPAVKDAVPATKNIQTEQNLPTSPFLDPSSAATNLKEQLKDIVGALNLKPGIEKQGTENIVGVAQSASKTQGNVVEEIVRAVSSQPAAMGSAIGSVVGGEMGKVLDKVVQDVGLAGTPGSLDVGGTAGALIGAMNSIVPAADAESL